MTMTHHLLINSPLCCTALCHVPCWSETTVLLLPIRKAHHISATTKKALYNRYTHLVSCDPTCKQRPVSACGSRSGIKQTAQEKRREKGSSVLKY